MSFPDWVKKHKTKGLEIYKVKDRYYLRKIKSQWNPQKKRAQKITLSYIGRITEKGIILPKHKQLEEKYKQVSVKEFGATRFLQLLSQDIVEGLQEHFPYDWREIFVLSLFRLIEKTHLNSFSFHYNNSYISESIGGLKVSQKFVGKLLREVGSQRLSITSYLNQFTTESTTVAIDLTNIFINSERMVSAMLGKNKDYIYRPQVNLILLYSLDKSQPIHFRMVPGSIRDISTVIRTVDEASLKDVIFIGDKGFNSKDNIDKLNEKKIKYVLATKRDSSKIDYDKVKNIERKPENAFVFDKRAIWFHVSTETDERIITYVDGSLKSFEESDLMIRISALEEKEKSTKLKEKEKNDLENYKKRLYETHERTGTLTVRTNLAETPEKIYQILKSRSNIEQAFDTLKNNIEVEKSYMRNDKQLEGWMFINFISLQLYYKIYAKLLEKEMLNNYSPYLVITHLKRIMMLKIDNNWKLAEIPKKTKQTLKKIGMTNDILPNEGEVTV